MGRDEHGTLTRLKAHRTERLEPVLARHGGRLVKLTGDGALVEFPSAVDALGAAIEFQQAMAEANRDQPEDTAIVFRIGLHLGDLIVDGDDLYGDGVNVAARLEAEAPAGGIVVSYTVRDAVVGRLKAAFDDLGGLALKNIERPVQAFGVKWVAADWKVSALKPSVIAAPPSPADAPLALPDKPSIAVLPFQNMSGDPEQEYFADGMVEDIITALSRFKSLFVIARNSSFSYKGKSPDIRHVGRELGVRYVLEGSVRKAGGKVRITGQLIDSQTGAHLWADRFEGSLDDVFELQDKIVLGTVSVLDQSIVAAEIERSSRKPTSSLGAYDYYFRGLAALRRFTKESVDEAESLFARATEADPNFAAAYGYASWCQIARKGQAWTTDFDGLAAEATRLAHLTWEADKDDAHAIGIAGYALAYVAEDLDTGYAWIERALSNNANVAFIWAFAAATKVYLCRFDDAIELAERAIRLSPRDSAIVLPRNAITASLFCLGRYAEAASRALANLREYPRNVVALRNAAASLAMSGDLVQARNIMTRLHEGDPTLSQATLLERMGPYRTAKPKELYATALRLAGLPEGTPAPAPLALPDKPEWSKNRNE